MNTVIAWFTPANRRRLYLTLIALVPIVSLYGWASEEQIAAWVGVVGAMLGLSTAAINTPVHTVDNASSEGGTLSV